MSEVNHNATSFDSESVSQNSGDRAIGQNEVTEISDCVVKNGQVSSEQSPSASSQTEDANLASESSLQEMDWKKVAHKLREYNRKLLKQEFRLKQQLAEINNRFNKSVEKSQNSDLLMARQAEEIENYQETIALLTQQLTSSQQQLDVKEATVEHLTEQYELSQQQTAQLERECTLLQEKYDHKAFELLAKEQQNQELQTQLSHLQHEALQREAELKRYQEAEAARKAKASSHQNYPHNKYIQPWSTLSMAEPKIALPKAKSAKAPQIQKPAETIKTAAKIATWSTPIASGKQVESKTAAKSQGGKKPQSLAAVNLPSFPRQQ